MNETARSLAQHIFYIVHKPCATPITLEICLLFVSINENDKPLAFSEGKLFYLRYLSTHSR